MTRFFSTRGSGPVRFTEALFRGLAPDGGLYLPRLDVRLNAREAPEAGDFSGVAAWVGWTLLEAELEAEALERIVEDALDYPVPLVDVEPGVGVLELFHGPTAAFKDVGARFMARAMAELNPDPDRLRTILVATSGDTGSAVARAFLGMDGFRVVVLFPADGVSPRQRRQMTTLGENVLAVATRGTFDDCQGLAKQAFGDPDLRERCGLTSANSINVGRLLPQSFYYVHAALLRGWDAPTTFVVPSGNLGNLTGGLLAHRMGMPAAGFVAATNVNRAFLDYLESGRAAARPSVSTLSNAMDVGDPSNLERIRALYSDDVSRVAVDVVAASVDDVETERVMEHVHARTGYLLDPHTAVGFRALEACGVTDGVVLSTAHPAKFPEVVERVTGRSPPVPEGVAKALAGHESMTHLDVRFQDLRDLLLEGVP